MIRSLSRTEERWAFAALGAIYPSRATPGLPVGVCDLELGAYLRDLFQHVPLTAAVGLRIAIWIVALAPPFVLHRMATVVGLGAEERRDLVTRLLASPRYGVRQLVVALKAIGGLFFGGAASVHAAIFDRAPSSSGARLLPASALVRAGGDGGRDAERKSA